MQNARRLELAFGGLVAQISDWTALWRHVVEGLVKTEKRMFQAEGMLDEHGAWVLLSKAYEKAECGKYGDQPIEQASERRRRSIVGAREGHVEELLALSMRFGTTVPYAIYQQTGTQEMAARRIFEFTDEDKIGVQKEIQRQALQFTRRLGFTVASGVYSETEGAGAELILGM